jgi:hypothetical protein
MKYNLFKSKADWEDYIRTGILSTNIEPFFKKNRKAIDFKGENDEYDIHILPCIKYEQFNIDCLSERVIYSLFLFFCIYKTL